MAHVTSWRAAAILIVLMVVTSSSSGQQQQQQQGKKKAVVCYYASWSYYKKGIAKYTLDNVPVHKCTHLVYAFAVLDEDTFTTIQHDPWLDDSLGHYRDFVRLKERNPDLKVLLGLGGWVDSRKDLKYSRLVSNPERRRAFVSHMVSLLLQYGFDGLDLDWEFPGWEGEPGDKEGFTAWVKDLREAFDPHGLELTSSVSAGLETVDRGYDIPAIAPHLDLILLMSYDFHGNWENTVAHPSPLYSQPGRNPNYNVQGAVDHLVKRGAPPEKIVMGIPFYGVSWTMAGRDSEPGAPSIGAGRPGPHFDTEGKMAYYEVCLAKQQGGWRDVRGTGGSYMVKDDQWVAYDDTQTLREKAEYVNSRGLGGVMIWDITTDDFGNYCGEGHNPLLTAVTSALHGTPAPPPLPTTPTPPPQPVESEEIEEIDDNILRFNASRSIILSPCIVRYDGTKHCPSDFTTPIGTAAPTPSPVTSEKSVTEPTYAWQAWPVFSRTTTMAPHPGLPPIRKPTPPPPPPPVRPRPPLFPIFRPRPLPPPASLTWYESCSALGFASDPLSCGSFYKCTNNYAYRFHCPAGLLWRQDPGLCDWPWAVQCVESHSPPDLTFFLPPPTARFQ